MNILALDLATKTGWALREHDRIESGVETFEPKRHESRGMRFVAFNRWLERMATMGDPNADRRSGETCVSRRVPRVEIIVYEQAHHRGGAATEIAAGFVTRVHELCARHGIEYAAVHSATLKKFTTGKGNGDKDAMRRALLERGWWAAADKARAPIDDNEVDAVALLHYALAEIVPAGRS